MNQEKKEKLSIMSELVKMARADLEVREEEHEFLYAIAKQLGLTDEEFESVFNKYIDFTPPKGEFDRILQFHRLVLMMNVDMDNDDREEYLVHDLGIRLGLPEGAIKAILNEMENYPNKIVPPDRLITIFKTFNN